MIPDSFYGLPEYRICDALAISEDQEAKHFWCDGVLPAFEHEYSAKYVNDHRRIVMTAYCGKNGQDLYELTVVFGKKALSRYARGLDISTCIPESPDGDFFAIDISYRKMIFRLD